ncbi:unnamed protein product [Paramecium sonneborni]|uniref:HTH La-type RNA-binding domain-containing protein n=1 Tax=Paramecium sonneborni TaxID=65129 RepID=A0A8S1NZX1_9CILI|nr:unnamed protein product [Paramecium sonneborni]
MRLKLIIHHQNNTTENILLFSKPQQTIEELCNQLSKSCNLKSPQILIQGFRALNDQLIENLVINGEIIEVVEGIGQQNKIIQKEIKVRQKQINQQQIQENSSEEEQVQVQKKQPQIQNQNQKTSQIKSNLIARPGQFQQKSQQINEQQAKPNIQSIVSESESSSEDKPIKKSQPVNKMSLKIQSPEEEIKNKQEEWKKTFTKGIQKQNEQQKQTQQQKQTEQQKSQQQKSIIKFNTLQIDRQQIPLDQNKEKQQTQQISTKSNTPLNEYIKLSIKTLKEDPTLIEKNDEILFKYNYLDIEKCQPTVSTLLSGKVEENILSEKLLKIQIKRNEIISIYYSEFSELQINITTISSQTRKAAIKVLSQDADNTSNQQQQQIQNQCDNDTNNIKQQQKEVIDPFGIGQQINYYYSDKNYSKDNFILQHSASDPEKYMLCKLLLNFPKVKATIKSEEELLDIIELFQRKTKQDLINFELKQNDQGTWMIRKKNIV